MNAGQMIDTLLDTFTLDTTIAGLLAHECYKRAKAARDNPDERAQWTARAVRWERAEDLIIKVIDAQTV